MPQLQAPPLNGAKIRLRSLFLREINVTANPVGPDGDDGLHKTLIPVTWSVAVVRSQEGRQVNVRCELKRPTEGETAYSGVLTAVAEYLFENTEKLTPGDQDKASAWAAINPAVGMLRTYVSILTGAGPYPQVLLSPVQPAMLVQAAVMIQEGTNSSVALYPSPPTNNA